jgi:RNA polymerase sigma-70 factor, ECF subfamily
MPHDPETRPSLIARLQGGVDDAAWGEFVAIYRPMIVRLAIRRGLQHPDAEDVAQGVLLSVSRGIRAWKLDPGRARFRTWLRQVVRNATINAIVRRPADRAPGGTTAVRALGEVAEDGGDIASQFEDEWRREAFRWASDEVRNELHPSTWDAFRMTAVEGLDAGEVARRTGKSVGAVYVARCRVMQKIQAKVRELVGPDPSDGDRESEGSLP